MRIGSKLDRLDRAVRDATVARDRALRTFRLNCKHMVIATEEGSPPHRICLNCGAIERGWHCGYQVLCLPEEINKQAPARRLSDKTHRSRVWACWNWPPYFVGQSHPNFSHKWDYKSLTAIDKVKRCSLGS